MLSRIIALLRRDAWLYLQLAVLPVGALIVMEGALFWILYKMGMFPLRPGPATSQQATAFITGILLILPVVLAAYSLFEGASCFAALATMQGEPVSFGIAFRRTLRRAWRLIWMMLLRIVAVMLPYLAAILVLGGAAAVMSLKHGFSTAITFVAWPLIVVLYFGGLAWALWIWLRLALATPACIAEDVTGWSALKRSDQLSRGGKWRILGVFFLVGLIAFAAVFALEMVFLASLALSTLASTTLHLHAHYAIWTVGSSVLGAVLIYVILSLQWASFAVTMTVLYQDQRFRHEGSLVLPLGS
ncbi:MAG: hypothetical protein ACLGSD_09510 [Acidobacteriota bacterium]